MAFNVVVCTVVFFRLVLQRFSSSQLLRFLLIWFLFFNLDFVRFIISNSYERLFGFTNTCTVILDPCRSFFSHSCVLTKFLFVWKMNEMLVVSARIHALNTECFNVLLFFDFSNKNNNFIAFYLSYIRSVMHTSRPECRNKRRATSQKQTNCNEM